jgi:hypothetical protein
MVCCSDFGFDPLRLGEVPENLERYKESELIHCRWAMLAVVSLLLISVVSYFSYAMLSYPGCWKVLAAKVS